MNEEATSEKISQEEYEAQVAGLFLELFNKAKGTDYKVGPVEPQRSIVDRRGISSSGKYKDLKLQFKRVKKWERDTMEKFKAEEVVRRRTKEFDVNIFKHLRPTLRKARDKYKDNPQVNDIVLVLEVGTEKEWLEGWKREVGADLSAYPFKGIYCISDPTIIETPYILPVKEIKDEFKK